MAPTFRHSRGTVVLADSVDLSCALQNVEWDASLDTAEVTTLCESDRAYLAGVREASFTADGFFDSNTTSVTDLFDTALGSTDFPQISVFLPPASTGSYAKIGQAVATAHTIASPFSGAVTAMMSAQANGYWAGGHVLAPLAARAAATTHAAVDSALGTTGASTAGGVGHLHVTAGTTAGGTTGAELTMVIQDSSNASAWADYITFTSVSSTDPRTHQRVSSTADVERYVRARASAQNSTSITYAVAFARLR